MSKKTVRGVLWTIASITVFAVIGVIIFLNRPIFGKLAEGERLARMEDSPNYRDGKFRNRIPRASIGEDKSALQTFRELMLQKTVDRKPTEEIPTVDTDLGALPI